MKPLLIVESKSKCKKIEELLDNRLKCVASYGHIRELKSLENIYECIFSNIKKNVEQLREHIKNADEVILATDDDREGESIAWHICKVYNLNIKTTKRIVFNEITKSALENAIKHPRTVNLDIVEAQTSRMIIDRIVGFTVSPLLWENINRASKLSAGRCQTPALRIIYDNHIDIQKSTHTYIYKIKTAIQNCIFELNKQFEEEEDVVDFLDESKEFPHSLSRESTEITKKSPPKPFITSSLQQSASNKYNMSPSHLMKIAQNLYQTGKITYMRTDNPNISLECSNKIRKYILTTHGEPYLGTFEHVHSSDTYAHECIRPTNIFLTDLDNKYNPQERNIYKMIWRQTIQSCMAEAKGQAYWCNISAPQKYFYKYRFEKYTFLGFLIMQDVNHETKYDMFMNIRQDVIKLKEIYTETHISNMKLHYTEAKLIRLLESYGIGRPSTYAMLVDKIKTKGYVEKKNIEGNPVECTDYTLENKKITTNIETKLFGKENNKLLITPMGLLVVEFCIKHFDYLFNYDYTCDMERRLDDIAMGKDNRKQICVETTETIDKLASKIEKNKEYNIEQNYYYIVGKYGPCIKVKNDDGQDKFLSIKKNITIDDIINKQLKICDIVDDNIIGDYNGETLYKMNGKYGPFTKYKGKTYSLKNIDISVDGVANIIENKSSDIVKKISDDISIRTGKFGKYIYYKTTNMSKPVFLGFKKYKLKLTSSISDIENAIEQYYN
jgi:DNA topoisomerase I